MKIDIGKVDWRLLRKQKDAVVYLSMTLRSPRIQGLLVGLTNFIDCIQDTATEELGKKRVFCRYRAPQPRLTDYEKIIGKILKVRPLLPTLIGIDDQLDKMIAKELKKDA